MNSISIEEIVRLEPSEISRKITSWEVLQAISGTYVGSHFEDGRIKVVNYLHGEKCCNEEIAIIYVEGEAAVYYKKTKGGISHFQQINAQLCEKLKFMAVKEYIRTCQEKHSQGASGHLSIPEVQIKDGKLYKI